MKDRKDKRERKAPLYKSFGYAFEGIYNTIRSQGCGSRCGPDCGNYVGNHWRYDLPAEDHGCYNVIVQHSPRAAERLGIIIQ